VKARPRVLLLHGFSASPWEVAGLARHLRQRGCLVEAPLLAGHGGGREAFDAAGRRDWLRSAEEAWERLRAPGEKIILIGHSMGGCLATLLAARHASQVEALVLGAPAFRLASPWAFLSLLPPARWIRPSLQFPPVHADSKHWILDYASSRVGELFLLGRQASQALPALKMPVLMLQADGDDLVSCAANERLFKKIPAGPKRLIVYRTREHNVFHRYNPHQRRAFEWVDEFLNLGKKKAAS
jgi:carboxylesterase